jgi:hypothetical protein
MQPAQINTSGHFAIAGIDSNGLGYLRVRRIRSGRAPDIPVEKQRGAVMDLVANPEVMPSAFTKYLAGFRACLFDGECGEPIAWGFPITDRMSEDEFRELGAFGYLECVYPSWFLITRRLTREEAIVQYGQVTDEEFGPRGGWKSVTFGTKTFCSRTMRSSFRASTTPP